MLYALLVKFLRGTSGTEQFAFVIVRDLQQGFYAEDDVWRGPCGTNT